MKKIILLSAFILALASCSAPKVEEVAAPATDSTAVVVDTTCSVTCDSAKVEVCK